jgi:3-oxoacyl-[acyl-carrier protein] reductase
VIALADRIVLVTGAASGIGRATARAAGALGATLVLGDLDERALEGACAEVRAAGGRAEAHELDVVDPTSVGAFVDAAVAAHGRVDGLVTSAGTTTSEAALNLGLDDWNRVLAVNLTGTFLVAQRAARVMADSAGGGSIVTISSALATTGQRRGAHYAASKAGVIALTKTLALELGPLGIRVNNVAPGATESPLLRRTVTAEFLKEWVGRNPLGRLGAPEDQAAAACFLLSDASSWITGQTLHVNGGSIMP